MMSEKLIPAKGIDRAVPFKTLESLKQLRDLGYTFVGRYLTKNRSSWKGLTRFEAELITKADMYVVCVYQNAGNKPQYFTELQGRQDAHDAIDALNEVGAPDDAVIYFAVDYDTRTSILGVLSYFKGITDCLAGTSYRIGVYGSYNTVIKVTGHNKKVQFKWQTLAWSGGKVCKYNLFQWKIDTYIPENKKLTGFDLNKSNGAGGGWKAKS